jgi:hypothetical protein
MSVIVIKSLNEEATGLVLCRMAEVAERRWTDVFRREVSEAGIRLAAIDDGADVNGGRAIGLRLPHRRGMERLGVTVAVRGEPMQFRTGTAPTRLNRASFV